jgi:hypothetical protein
MEIKMTNRKQIDAGAQLRDTEQKSMMQKVDLILSLAGSDPATMLAAISYALVNAANKCDVTPMSVISVLAQMFDDLEESEDENQDE